MVMVLNTIGLPAKYMSYILPVDWLLYVGSVPDTTWVFFQ